MDKNNLIGFLLLSVLLVIYLKFNTPDPEQIIDEEVDKINVVEDKVEEELPKEIENIIIPDSVLQSQQTLKYGDFGSVTLGENKIVTLKNDKISVNFNTKGGQIASVQLLEYTKEEFDSTGINSTMVPLYLLSNPENSIGFKLPVNGVLADVLNTNELVYEPVVNGNTITMRATGLNGSFVEQVYTISNDYTIEYGIKVNSARGFKNKKATFEWVNHLEKIERSVQYEKMYSTVAYKEVDENPNTLSYTGADEEKFEGKVNWVSHSNQFFSSSIMTDTPFLNVEVAVDVFDDEHPDLKKMETNFTVNTDQLASGYNFKWNIGPNKFADLQSFDNGLENIIPFGWSIFGTINRWIIRPIFDFFSGLVGNAGIAILLLTLLVKLMVYPLMYKMLYSQSKMAALKPKIEAMKKKLGDDKQAASVETMKLYREYGASPFGGCLPQLLQLPLWFALYRFFPASIDFRQEGFLWATDLSTYDVFARFPNGFDMPFYGNHISMFTILWAIATLIFSYYNSKHMDFTANPSMKYMQYAMPVMFLFFFNSYASGLTLYLFFGVLFNILQTYVTKNIIIDQEKIKLELEVYKSKPKKKKSGFAAKLEDAMNQQKAIQEKKKNKK